LKGSPEKAKYTRFETIGFACCAPQRATQDNADFGSVAARWSCARRHIRALYKEAKMATGTVKWFNPTKGYGFIQPQGGGKDVFVHISAVEKAGLTTLNEGQQVQYELVTNRGKTSAENLKVG
jgi:CspA family cold shock protein